MQFRKIFCLFCLFIAASLIWRLYNNYDYTPVWLRRLLDCEEIVQKQINMDLIFPPGVVCAQPRVRTSRPDVTLSTPWSAPIVWERTFDVVLIDSIYKHQNVSVASVLFALGKYMRFVKDFLDSAEQHFMVGYPVHYYLFTDLPYEVPEVRLGKERTLTVIPTPSVNRWQEISLLRMKMMEKLIEEELLYRVDYMFSFDVDAKFHGHWGAESLGDLVGVLHPFIFGFSRKEFPYERRPESQAYISTDEGDYYYEGAVIGGRPFRVHKLAKACRVQMEKDRANQIEAVWQDESHVNKYFLYKKPTKVLSPEYIWNDQKAKPRHMKVVRFSQVAKNYSDVRPNP